MRVFYLLVFFTFISIILVFGQNNVPKLSGEVVISVKNGTFQCDLELTDLELPQEYFIRLNSGMNILNMEVKNPDAFLVGFNRDLTDSIQSDETVSYYIPSNTKGEKFCPNNIRFRYVGKFPVIKDTIWNKMQREDWRGNVAFVNGNLRVDGSQSAWFPTIYMPKIDFQYDKIRYDITVKCSDCTTLYFNGNKPIKSSEHRFVSDIPREPYMFLGDYNIQKNNYAYFLNANFSKEELIKIEDKYKNIYQYLTDYTSIPIDEKIYWVNGGYTSKTTGFLFPSFPTITVVGPPPLDLNNAFKEGEAYNINYIVHELGHYYFSHIKQNNSYLELLLDEGFAEFLAFKYVIQNKDKDFFKNGIREAFEWFEDSEFKYKPILDFNKPEDMNDRETYAYGYQTAILFSIEKEIGEEKMQKWIRLLLQGDEPISNKDFFKTTLKKAINNDKKYNDIIAKYLTGGLTVQNMKKLWNE